ncbi:MAG: AMP-binding protein, partial [Armatimonadota bacterium]
MQEFDLPIAWTPDEALIAQSNLTAQMRKHGIDSYEAFLQRSISDPDWFWRAFFEDVGFYWHTPYQQTLDVSRGKPWAKWFVGGRLNWTYNALDRHVQAGAGDRPALLWEGEEGAIRRYTYRQLLEEVNALARGLLALGVQPGDRVGLFLPFTPEVAIALLAVSRIGAIALPLFSGFGPEPVQTRLQDAEARWLFVADGFPRRGKIVSMKEVADAALQAVPTVEKVIVVERAGRGLSLNPEREVRYTDLLQPGDYEAPAFDSDQPCMMIYTSGTTGKPKAAFHVHAGFPIKAAQDMYHLFDLKPSDTISWLTDIGWMMGPWLIMGGLILGATVFMYDGSPDHPAPDRLWEMVERHGITVLGLTPTLIRALMREGDEYADRH